MSTSDAVTGSPITPSCGEDVERGPTNIVTAFKKHSIICPLYKDNKALQVDEHNGTYPCDIDWPGKGAFTKKKTSLTVIFAFQSHIQDATDNPSIYTVAASTSVAVQQQTIRMEIDEQQGRNLPAFPASWEPSSAEEDGYSSSTPSDLNHSSNERSGDSDSLAPAPPASLETPSDAQAAEELSALARRRRTALNIAWLSGN
ncbi:hypothetical protein H0H92_001726 [Tricholoma furcatifolium]|nr:hypothetical protein H0H92_001726 [Tricholoma furcatifolium]